MNAWSRNERDAFRLQSRVEINPPDSLQKLLIEEPLLDPNKSCVVVLHGDHHGALTDDPVPQLLRDRSQVGTYSANDHEKQSARGELILAAEHVFEKFDHVVRSVITEGTVSSSSSASGTNGSLLPHLRFFHVLLPRSRSTTTLCMSARIANKLSKVSRTDTGF
jgi:hypothetical protein